MRNKLIYRVRVLKNLQKEEYIDVLARTPLTAAKSALRIAVKKLNVKCGDNLAPIETIGLRNRDVWINPFYLDVMQ